MRARVGCVVVALSGLFMFCVAHADEESYAVSQDKEMSARDVKSVAALKQWYVGGTVGWGGIKGEDMTAVNNYYSSLGYTDNHEYARGRIGNALNPFVGYRQHDYLDIDVGYYWFESYSELQHSNPTSGNYIETRRTFTAAAFYLSALFRPPASAYYHGLYFKLGAHISRLKITKDILESNVSQSTLNTIVAGDNIAGDGVSWGVGPLIGLGFDFRTGKVGAVRLEVNRYFRLGGTSYGVASVNLGYLGNF